MNDFSCEPHVVIGDSLDELIQKGVLLIEETGEDIKVRAGTGKQSYSVIYVLKNSRRRLHLLRAPTSIRYLSRELIAYFRGSLRVSDGLSSASKFWDTLADEHGMISSNYGYYVFHQRTEEGTTQYEWVIKRLLENLQTRRAVININGLQHKKPTKDFPCTIAIQFFVKNGHLCCEVSSRSTDVITGLPYDMGFFSLLTEIVFKDLQERKYPGLKLGYTSMKPSFTQIYSARSEIAKEILNTDINTIDFLNMPELECAGTFLEDIYNQTSKSEVMSWIREHSGLANDN